MCVDHHLPTSASQSDSYSELASDKESVGQSWSRDSLEIVVLGYFQIFSHLHQPVLHLNPPVLLQWSQLLPPALPPLLHPSHHLRHLGISFTSQA